MILQLKRKKVKSTGYMLSLLRDPPHKTKDSIKTQLRTIIISKLNYLILTISLKKGKLIMKNNLFRIL